MLTLPNPWNSEFPGDSFTLQSLKSTLHHADLRRLRSRNQLDSLESELDSLALPPQYWNRRIRDTLSFLERRHHQAERQFQRALKLLIHTFAALQKPSSKPPEPTAPPQTPTIPPSQMVYMQTATIRVTDGVTTTVVRPTASFYLEKESMPVDSIYRRQLVFHNGTPDEYAYARTTGEGKVLPPAGVVYINYSQEEFLRICRLEVDSNAPHLLDGPRLKTTYLPPPQ